MVCAVRRLLCLLLIASVVPLGARCAEDSPTATSSTSPGPKAAPTRPPKGSVWKPSGDPKKAVFLGFEGPKPAVWIEHPSSSKMRVANFTVPGRDGHDAAHIVVFHFGKDQGGTVNANITRWQGQFRPDDNGNPLQPTIERFEVSGMPVTLVEFQGDWMKMGAAWYTNDQHFITAIVESPVGMIFIRFSGHAATVAANRDDFLTMVRGLKQEESH